MAVEESVIRRVRVSHWLELLPGVLLGAAGWWLWRESSPPLAYGAIGLGAVLAADWWLRSTTLTSRRLVVRSGPGADPFRIFFVFDVPDPRQDLRSADVLPERTAVINQTAPEGATSASLVFQPLGPSASLESTELELAAPPEDGPGCA